MRDHRASAASCGCRRRRRRRGSRHHAVLAVRLGQQQRRIGGFQQLAQAAAVGGIGGQADRQGDRGQGVPGLQFRTVAGLAQQALGPLPRRASRPAPAARARPPAATATGTARSDAAAAGCRCRSCVRAGIRQWLRAARLRKVGMEACGCGSANAGSGDAVASDACHAALAHRPGRCSLPLVEAAPPCNHPVCRPWRPPLYRICAKQAVSRRVFQRKSPSPCAPPFAHVRASVGRPPERTGSCNRAARGGRAQNLPDGRQPHEHPQSFGCWRQSLAIKARRV